MTSLPSSATRSTTETLEVGTRNDIPSILPASEGNTTPIAAAAPVDVGTIDMAAARARLMSLCRPSKSFWSPVYACTVVMNPRFTPNSSFNTFTTGAKQLVVQDASEIMLCVAGSYISPFTPGTIVTSGSFAGAVIITFLQPASRCFDTSFLSRNFPVDSTTTSTPKSPQGNFPGSFSANIFSSLPFTTKLSFPALISPSCIPCTESYFSRCAIQEASAA